MSGASDEPERPSEVRIVGSYYFETGFLLLLASFRISCDKLFEITTLFARAKHGRVVENEYEKANCRHGPTRPDTAALTPSLKIDHVLRNLLILRHIPYLKIR